MCLLLLLNSNCTYSKSSPSFSALSPWLRCCDEAAWIFAVSAMAIGSDGITMIRFGDLSVLASNNVGDHFVSQLFGEVDGGARRSCYVKHHVIFFKPFQV